MVVLKLNWAFYFFNKSVSLGFYDDQKLIKVISNKKSVGISVFIYAHYYTFTKTVFEM